MYYRFAKVFHLLSVLLFIIAFMYTYSAMPEQVVLEADPNGTPLRLIGRDVFFYLGIGVFVILNVLLVTPAKLIENKATLNIRRLFEVGDPFRDYMLTWIYSFVAIINISIVIVAFYINGINHYYEMGSRNSAFWLYLLPVLFVVWIIGLFVILSRKVRQIKSTPQS